MIQLINVSKDYPTKAGPRRVLDNINLTIRPGERVGILGRNGAGKSTLVRLISGAEPPTTGKIERNMSVSWPLAFSGGFHGSLTGADNVRFICRIYGVDFESRFQFVQDFSELGIYINEPVMNYSSGMKARLAFAISMMTMQTIRERTFELAILKALGFGDRMVFILLAVESLVVWIAAALAGLALAWIAFPLAGKYVPGLSMPIAVVGAGIGGAVVLALISVTVPGHRAARLEVAEALAGR